MLPISSFVLKIMNIVAIASSKKIDPNNRNARMRKIIPANTPATDKPASANGSHGERATPLRKISAVEET